MGTKCILRGNEMHFVGSKSLYLSLCPLPGSVIFRGRVKKKYCCVRGGRGHYIKNKNIGGCVFQLSLVSKKGPNAKMRKKAKNYQTLVIFSSLILLTRHFYKIHISGAANRHAPVQYAKYFLFIFFLFFMYLFIYLFIFSKQSS